MTAINQIGQISQIFIQILPPIASAVVAIIIASGPLLRHFTRRVNGPLDVPLLQLVSVKRYPIDVYSWKKARANSTLFILSLVLPVTLLIYFSIIGSTSSSNTISNIQSTILTLIFFAICFIYTSYIIYFLRIRLMYSKNIMEKVYNQRYSLFKDAEIIVTSDYEYLFQKCHEALKRMNFSIAELDKNKAFIEIYHQGLLWRSAGHTTIHITSIENTPNTYVIKVKFTTLPKNKENFSRNSLITNRFINELITRPKDGDDKSKE